MLVKIQHYSHQISDLLFSIIYYANIIVSGLVFEAGGVVSATPEGIGHHHILLSVKMTLNARINMF